MYKESCEVLENRSVAPGHFALKLRSKKIAKAALPGQFVQILVGNRHACSLQDPFLPRPFSFLMAKGAEFSVLYHVVGKGTGLMAHFKKGDKIPVLGPLGKGFTLRPQTGDGRLQTKKRALLVGGGVGIPPLYHLAKTFLKNKTYSKMDIEILLGARNSKLLLCEQDFKRLGIRIFISTDDGSKGQKGFVTSFLSRRLQSAVPGLQSRIFACGPTPMLKAVSLIASEFGVPCEASVEVPMACGFGACLGCAIKVRLETRDQRPGKEDPNYRYAIACTEGPVFEGSKVLWD